MEWSGSRFEHNSLFSGNPTKNLELNTNEKLTQTKPE